MRLLRNPLLTAWHDTLMQGTLDHLQQPPCSAKSIMNNRPLLTVASSLYQLSDPDMWHERSLNTVVATWWQASHLMNAHMHQDPKPVWCKTLEEIVWRKLIKESKHLELICANTLPPSRLFRSPPCRRQSPLWPPWLHPGKRRGVLKGPRQLATVEKLPVVMSCQHSKNISSHLISSSSFASSASASSSSFSSSSLSSASSLASSSASSLLFSSSSASSLASSSTSFSEHFGLSRSWRYYVFKTFLTGLLVLSLV